jgi:hypothetical protein
MDTSLVDMFLPSHHCDGKTTLWRDPKSVYVLTPMGPQWLNWKLEVQDQGLDWGIYLKGHNECLSGHEAANLSRLKKNALCT